MPSRRKDSTTAIGYESHVLDDSYGWRQATFSRMVNGLTTLVRLLSGEPGQLCWQ